MTNIGLVGLAGAGKSAVADRLVAKGGYVSMGFADPLRAMAAAINPIVDINFWDDEALRYNEALALRGYGDAKAVYPEVRRFLQVLGTDAVRGVLGEKTWVDVARRTIEVHLAAGRKVVVTDVRFPNELALLEHLGFTTVRVLRPGAGVAGAGALHPSETALDHVVLPTIHNNGTLDQLHTVADRLACVLL